MKRIIPTVIAMSIGLIVLLDFFLDNLYLDMLGRTFIDWVLILASFALILGVVNLLRVHFRKIRRRENGWPYSFVLILTLWVVITFGLLDAAGPEGAAVSWVFNSIQYPLQAAIFSLLAFFTLSAAYRAFRIRQWESLFFVLAGLLVLLGAIPLGQLLWDGFGDIRTWILAVPAMAGARGIILGVSLATVITGLRLLLGIDRPYAE